MSTKDGLLLGDACFSHRLVRENKRLKVVGAGYAVRFKCLALMLPDEVGVNELHVAGNVLMCT